MTQKAPHLFRWKYLVAALTFLMGCSNVFDADDYEISGVKTTTDIALPLAFGEITIEDIIERQYSTQKIFIVGNLASGNDNNIVLDDTVDLDLGDIENSEVLTASLKINTENEMPIEGIVELNLVDVNYNVIETLVPADKGNWIKSSTVDGSGNLVTKGIFNELIELDKAKVDKLFEAKKMIVKARLSTKKDNNGVSQPVVFNADLKLFNHYGLRVKLKTQVDL